MAQTLTLKRVMELWTDIPVIYTITSTDTPRVYNVHVQVDPIACINKESESLSGDYVVHAEGVTL